MDTMDALVVEESAPQRLHLDRVPAPRPATHEALVEVRAAGVNPTDPALRVGGAVLGRRVMVTGATRAVGALAVHLASLGGASGITAVMRSAASSAHLRDLGATETVTDPRDAGAPADIVIDTVGGAVLSRAFEMTAADGTLVSVGRASGEDVVLPADALEGAGGRAGRALRTFFMPDEPGDLRADLEFLLRLVDEGHLEASVEYVEDLGGALPLLRAGRWAGRLVLATRGE